MNRLVIVASVIALAGFGVNCGSTDGSGDGFSAAAVTAPSALDGGVNGTMARGSGGGGKSKPGPGGTTGGGGRRTVVMVVDANRNGAPHWNDSIRFNVSTTATTEPHVAVQCTRDGRVIYSADTGYYAGYPWPWTQTMQLSSMSWQGGAAQCLASLYAVNGADAVSLSSLNFSVAE